MNLHLSRRLIDSRQRMILHLFYVRIFRLLMSQFPSSFLFFIDFFFAVVAVVSTAALTSSSPSLITTNIFSSDI